MKVEEVTLGVGSGVKKKVCNNYLHPASYLLQLEWELNAPAVQVHKISLP